MAGTDDNDICVFFTHGKTLAPGFPFRNRCRALKQGGEGQIVAAGFTIRTLVPYPRRALKATARAAGEPGTEE
jgi:hypothetical protein